MCGMDAPAIGALIRAKRQALGLTQEELAALVGVNVSTVIDWESGKHYPRRKLGKVEQVLGSLASDDKPDPEPPVNPDRDESVEEMLNEWAERSRDVAERTREMEELAERIARKRRQEGEADGSYRRRAG